MIVATALLLQMASPPSPPAGSGSHPYPAQRSEQMTTGRCGRQDIVVRKTTHAGTLTQRSYQSVEVSIAGKRVPQVDAIRLNRAVTAFGAASSVDVYCIAGQVAQLRFYGPVSGSDQGKQMIVDFDRDRITDVR
ncbi:hypothetical protein [Sphingomonas xinjiangensis]|uniref:Uncharacterized protein n=1 Tax=Sphingomonas xinjiangensis TaxID=643568 RepID=A0A840YSG6_9SPHN|nr:hypothetical protein [Sphingomonas xinjiangensis]MBB5712618.1 hypothetical protein [Sphingomonas xinjiangensis]